MLGLVFQNIFLRPQCISSRQSMAEWLPRRRPGNHYSREAGGTVLGRILATRLFELKYEKLSGKVAQPLDFLIFNFKRSAHSAVPVQWLSGSVVQWFIGFRARFFFSKRGLRPLKGAERGQKAIRSLFAWFWRVQGIPGRASEGKNLKKPMVF